MRCLNCRLDGIGISKEICPRCGVHLPTLFQNVLPPGKLLRGSYDHFRSFYEGLAAVKTGDKWGYIRNPLK